MALFRRVAVLMGGPSSEREVSLRSGRAVATGLRDAGYDVTEVDLAGHEIDLPPDVEAVFIALHGTFGEDGDAQAILDSQRIPYTGSGAAASRAAFDKILSKQAFDEGGIATPAYEIIRAGEKSQLDLPVVVKPPRQGSSIGVHRVMDESGWEAAIADALVYDDEVLVESYIEGRELTVGIVDDELLPLVEIAAPDAWYDYEAKYGGGSQYLVPAPVEEAVADRCRYLTVRTFEILGCRGFARVDFRVDGIGQPYTLELNSIPGFTETSLLPKAAAAAGMSFSELCDRIMRTASFDGDEFTDTGAGAGSGRRHQTHVV
ncbi:MAG: D-alanine--D-alanine ligase [Kiritimatiellia bacterium]|nr:D-alanine--D-alanine ligase [Kiritimatiellia bacterium]MDP6847845.1 D-alanine--D-alanine ligase [Kiritimatiellia bacterium]